MNVYGGRAVIEPPAPGIPTLLGTYIGLYLCAPTTLSIVWCLIECLLPEQSSHCEPPKGRNGVVLIFAACVRVVK